MSFIAFRNQTVVEANHCGEISRDPRVIRHKFYKHKFISDNKASRK